MSQKKNPYAGKISEVIQNSKIITLGALQYILIRFKCEASARSDPLKIYAPYRKVHRASVQGHTAVQKLQRVLRKHNHRTWPRHTKIYSSLMKCTTLLPSTCSQSVERVTTNKWQVYASREKEKGPMQSLDSELPDFPVSGHSVFSDLKSACC